MVVQIDNLPRPRVALDNLGNGCRGERGSLCLAAADEWTWCRWIESPTMHRWWRGRFGRTSWWGCRRVHEHRRSCTTTTMMRRRQRARGRGGWWDFLAADSGPGGGRWGTGPGDGFIRTVASVTRATARAKKRLKKKTVFFPSWEALFFYWLFHCIYY